MGKHYLAVGFASSALGMQILKIKYQESKNKKLGVQDLSSSKSLLSSSKVAMIEDSDKSSASEPTNSPNATCEQRKRKRVKTASLYRRSTIRERFTI